MVSLPESPQIPDYSHILNLWDFTDDAYEVTHFFQGLFQRLPDYFLAFFAIMLFFMVVPLIIRIAQEIM